jgi:hypothetical protein
MEYLNFMARNEKTTWRLFRRAAAEPGDFHVQLRAREQLRGIAVEMLTERDARKLFPGFRLTGRQVKMKEGHIIDNELTAMNGLRLQHGVEVKGWSKDKWRVALDAWEAQQQAKKLTERQERLMKQLQRLIDQLTDAAKPPRGPPFLVITDKLSEPSKEKLRIFLRKSAPETLVIRVEEAQILEKTKQLRAALKLTEDLSGGVP